MKLSPDTCVYTNTQPNLTRQLGVMGMFKKLLKNLLGNHSNASHKYRKYSSSDRKYRKGYGSSHRGHGHSHYGSSHYKRKHSSRSFFSS